MSEVLVTWWLSLWLCEPVIASSRPGFFGQSIGEGLNTSMALAVVCAFCLSRIASPIATNIHSSKCFNNFAIPR